jgi:hypothetical protein
LCLLACSSSEPDGSADARLEAGAQDAAGSTAGDAADAAQLDAAMARADAAARDGGNTQSVLDASADAAAPASDAGSDAGGADSNASAARCALCTDFEADAPGALPATFSARTPNCSGDGKAGIDDQVAHSGKKSLRVQSGGGTCNHMFATPTLDFAALGNAFWVRFYVRFEHELSDAHVTFLAMQDQVSKKALRMGGQKKILMWNRELDDATLPELSPMGIAMSVAPPAGQFKCVEFHLDGAAGTLETYVDSQLVPGLVVDAVGTKDSDGQWLNSGKWSAKASEIGFGWESYGSDAMTLWFDDIAIASERTGC